MGYLFACAYSLVLTFFLVYFSVVFTQGLGFIDLGMHGISDKEIRQIISSKVVVTVNEAIPEVFGSIMTSMIKIYDDRYGAVIEATVAAFTSTTTAARSNEGDSMQYRGFNNTMPP